jgi:hypothetical protein
VPPVDSSSDDTTTANDKDNAEVSEEPKVSILRLYLPMIVIFSW